MEEPDKIELKCCMLPNLPPCTIPLGHPSAPAPSILYPASNLDWRFVSYMILYMFQCHSPKSSHPLPRIPKDCSIRLCLFYCEFLWCLLHLLFFPFNYFLLFFNHLSFIYYYYFIYIFTLPYIFDLGHLSFPKGLSILFFKI